MTPNMQMLADRQMVNLLRLQCSTCGGSKLHFEGA
jgi:hypothetical protein